MTKTEMLRNIAALKGWTEIWCFGEVVGGIPPGMSGDENACTVPKWLDDANESLKLLEEMYAGKGLVSVYPQSGGWVVCYGGFTPYLPFCEAVATAYIRWMEKKKTC